MTRLSHSVIIDRPLSDVFQLATQVERYPEFLPGYLESRVVDREPQRFLLQRRGMVRGKIYEWRSWVKIAYPNHLEFEHAEGPLKGMRVEWTFNPQGPGKTLLKILHFIDIPKPRLWGTLKERFFFAPRIAEAAQSVVDAFKVACELDARRMTL